MNTPDYLRHLGDNAVDLVEEAFYPVIQSAARRIVKLGGITDSTQYELERLAEAGYLTQDVSAAIVALTGAGKDSPLFAEIETAMAAAAEKSIAFDNRIYEAAGKAVVPLARSPTLSRILQNETARVGADLANLTRTTAITTQSAFIQATSVAHFQVETGVLSYTQAIKQAVQAIKEIAGNGIYVRYARFDPKTGLIKYHRNTIETATRRAVLAGVNQATGEMQLQLALEMGVDTMALSAHWGARNKGFGFVNHESWQGKLVSLSNAPGYLSRDDIGYGNVKGFKGAGCRHDWAPHIEGVSETIFSEAKLRETAEATVVYNGEAMSLYDATQLQREMERDIRRSKRELIAFDEAASADGLDVIKAGMEYEYAEEAYHLKKLRERLDDFESQTGLPSQDDRQQIYGFGRSEAARATWGARKAGGR